MDSSSLPEGPNELGQLSPPIWPCTTRGLPCRPDCSGRGGLLPHRFTLTRRCHLPQSARADCFQAVGRFFLPLATEAHGTGGLFSVALSVAGNFASLARTARRIGPLALPGALPFSLRRFPAKTFVRGTSTRDVCPAKNAKTTVSGLSSRPAFLRRLAQRSPGLPAKPSISLGIGRRRLRRLVKSHNRREPKLRVRALVPSRFGSPLLASESANK
jgi:hypothetical protein